MDSVVTIKCSPREFQLMLGAVRYERDQLIEATNVMAPTDGYDLRRKVGELNDLALRMRV